MATHGTSLIALVKINGGCMYNSGCERVDKPHQILVRFCRSIITIENIRVFKGVEWNN
jgi:hypothetical protein